MNSWLLKCLIKNVNVLSKYRLALNQKLLKKSK